MSGLADEAGEPLTAIFQRLIGNTGPISVQYFMGESNARYYASRDPLGDAGDFITAPEISQMFGELVGLWLADVWLRAGSPEPVHYVELGPGRGTLARDALRSAAKFGLVPKVHFVEGSTALKALQVEAVPQAVWHADLASLPTDSPILLVANEFLDALPIRQLVKTQGGWRERMVAVHDGAFVGLAGERPMDAAVPEALRQAEPGTLIETCPGAAAVVYEVAGRLVEQGGAALFVDYGHDAVRTGSTLQALRAHRKVDAFAHPGEADLTAHVDFATLANVALSRGCRWLGTVRQGDWLCALGIEARAQSLARFAPEHAAAIAAARDRLIAEDEMGALFKVMGLASPRWPDGAGF
ncbi:NADH dehydrogenase [ubiquinone] 1 alpha subcomplex assembly factor 7 [Novosphingobium chloroacetimidivorans]|uniref:NADH dehydrogenase [ubiquinone] 1 alpha subcomplex assembly factor 7 n=1 Tax=Novosphingobium chloroacetimidivorans TaxID=1428314 RepID=A0A7W7KC62_9SPHN|nr:NADH dehydrogenase [ubiquinone] 1 alpha subcomplex assembly factor 7 [Novosphingobium chloroacetimidivorans]